MVPSFRTFAWLILFPLSALAQEAGDSAAFIPPSASIPGSVDAYFFPVFPMGDFGDRSGANAGLATLGIGVGVEYVFPIGATPFGWVTGAAVAINPIDKKEAEKRVADELPASDIKVDGGTWFNLPILTGVRCETRPVPHLVLDAQAQAGLDIANQADFSFTAPGYSGALASETAFAPGFMVGAGVTLFDRLRLAGRFFWTSDAHMKGEFHDTLGQTADQSGDIAITFTAITLGVQF